MLFAGLSGLATPFSPHWQTLTSAAALATAAPLLAAGALRLGFLANFMSRTVLVGFLSGVGVSLLIGQLPEMLGVDVHTGALLSRLADTLTQARHAHMPTALMSAGVLVTIVSTERWLPQLPGALIGVALAITATWAFGLDRAGIAI